MAIFTRWQECEIVAKFGKQQPPYFAYPDELVLVRYTSLDRNNIFVKSDRFYWAVLLKADDGWQEIETAMKSVPEYSLSSLALAGAFRDAE